MSGGKKRIARSDTTPLLDQLNRSYILPIYNTNRISYGAVSRLEMTYATAPPSRSRPVFLGVDVGTGSARAGLFDESGKLLGSASSPIQIWKEGDCVEQSSTDIWHALCAAVDSACSLANVDGEEVKGIGFEATCSLVAVDADGAPVCFLEWRF